MTQLVLHIDSYTPESEYFEEEQYNVETSNLSVIIYYDQLINSFVFLTNNKKFKIVDDDPDKYELFNKYEKFNSNNIDAVITLLSRMNINKQYVNDRIYGIYKLYKIDHESSYDNASYDKILKKLNSINLTAYCECYFLDKKNLEIELVMLKNISF
jgi:hypothetical protein